MLELLLRGCTIAEMAETSGLSFTTILKSITERDLANMALVHRMLVMARGYRLDKNKEDALIRLFAIATNLAAEYPDGMTPEQARVIDVQRRAILSILRLQDFPAARGSDSYQDERGPHSGSRTGECEHSVRAESSDGERGHSARANSFGATTRSAADGSANVDMRDRATATFRSVAASGTESLVADPSTNLNHQNDRVQSEIASPLNEPFSSSPQESTPTRERLAPTAKHQPSDSRPSLTSLRAKRAPGREFDRPSRIILCDDPAHPTFLNSFDPLSRSKHPP